jgi:hypothetical protein
MKCRTRWHVESTGGRYADYRDRCGDHRPDKRYWRPRRNRRRSRARKYSVSLALELAYLRDSDDAAGVYEQMVSFLEVL